MSSESEKVKERLIQAAKMFFFHVQDLVPFINTFIELFNRTMNTQILSMAMKEDTNIKDFFEQMLKNFKEMQAIVDEKHNKMQKETLFSKVATAVCFMADKCTNVDLHDSAKEVFKNIQTPVTVSVLSKSDIFQSLESSLSLLMKYPIMNLQLSDFCREDTKEKSEATTSEKTTSPDLSKTTTVDMLRKLQDALRPENANNSIEAAADQLEQIVKAMASTLQILQKAIKTMETDVSTFKKVNGK